MQTSRSLGGLSKLPRLTLSLATLAAVGFSIVLCTQLSWMQFSPRTNYALRNVLGVSGRNKLLLSLAVGVVAPVLSGLVLKLMLRERGLMVLENLATVLAPLALLFILPGLFLSDVAESKPLFYLVVLTGFGVATRALLASSLTVAKEMRPPPAMPFGAARFVPWPLKLRLPSGSAMFSVCLAGALFAWVLGGNAVAHHHLIQTIDTDIGISDNVMANLSLGRGFRAPALFGTTPGSYLTVHSEFVSWVFVPIYRTHPGAETLLRLQAVLAALSVVPLFLLARRLLGQAMAIWSCAAFLSLAPLHGALLYTFSWLPAFCLFSFTLYYAVLADRSWLVVLAAPLLLASSEWAPLAVLALGANAIGTVKRTRMGIALCLLAALTLAINALIMSGTHDGQQAKPLLIALRTICTNPVYFVLDLARTAKVSSMLHALAPLALLPLTISTLPFLLAPLLFTSAATEFWPGPHAAYPGSIIWIPGAVLATLLTLRRLRDARGRRPMYLASVITASLALLSHSYNFGALMRKDGYGGSSTPMLFQPTPASDRRYADIQSIVKKIPPSASVVATTFMLSHVSSRADVFDARRPHGEPDFIFLSELELAGSAREGLAATLSTHRYALVSTVGEFYLFRRGSETEATRSSLQKLGLLSSPLPATQTAP